MSALPFIVPGHCGLAETAALGYFCCACFFFSLGNLRFYTFAAEIRVQCFCVSGTVNGNLISWREIWSLGRIWTYDIMKMVLPSRGEYSIYPKKQPSNNTLRQAEGRPQVAIESSVHHAGVHGAGTERVASTLELLVELGTEQRLCQFTAAISSMGWIILTVGRQRVRKAPSNIQSTN